MKRSTIFYSIITLLIISSLSLKSQQKFFEAGDFLLENGSIIKDCRIGYQTFGQLNEDKSNAVLATIWFMGRSDDVKNYFCGVGRLYDTTKYYVIAVDPFGNGVSSSPSNSKEQSYDKFPHFSVADMVNAQYVLLTNELGVFHLHAIVGLSMGGMQALKCAMLYPDFMDKVVSLNGSPELTSYGKLLWTTELRVIENMKNCQDSKEKTMQIISGLQSLLFNTPEYIVDNVDEPAMLLFNNDEYYCSFEPSDWASQIKSFIDSNIFEIPKSKIREIIKSNIMVITNLRDHVVNPKPSIEFAESFNCKLLKYDSPYGHQLWLDTDIDLFTKINEFLKK